jgi:hypothetical protein
MKDRPMDYARLELRDAFVARYVKCCDARRSFIFSARTVCIKIACLCLRRIPLPTGAGIVLTAPYAQTSFLCFYCLSLYTTGLLLKLKCFNIQQLYFAYRVYLLASYDYHNKQR